MKHHIAQFEVVWLTQPLDRHDFADFKTAIDPIRGLADKAPGCVWRLISDGHNSASTLPRLGKDGIIKFTVWESCEAAAAWLYRSEQAGAPECRRDWFQPPMEPNAVMWWIPAGNTPTLEEALDRLQYLRSNGSTPVTFTCSEKHAPENAEAYVTEPGKPPLGDPHVGPAQAQRCIDAYIAAWNEPELETQRQMLVQVMTDDGQYADPIKQVSDRAGLVDYIGQVQARYPGGRIIRTSVVDVHRLACRFNWRTIKADGTSLPESVDFIDFARDGRICRITGFFGPLAPNPAS